MCLDISMDELYKRLKIEESGNFTVESFSVFWKDELVAEVQLDEKNVHIKRYVLNPAKQIFYADEMSRFVFGNILRTRCWDENRGDIDKLLASIGLEEYNPYEICKRTHGLMVQDFIWFRFPGEKYNYQQMRNLAHI